jgi:UDP-N-acetylglucosamine--N-acetylmuramyl-(pentapeptide) pyrophosphoryl-undecaprenol N-acetylglucosamine transferase
MKVVITGGHLSPALAVLEKLSSDEVFFIGRKYTFEGDKTLSFEYQQISKLNIPFFSITPSRFQRKFTRHTISSISKFPIGLVQTLQILKRIKPDIVLGFGGYISMPVIISAFILKIPIVIHEQTLEAGFANKMSSKFAKKICISWKSSEKFFPKEKIVLTGNPLRKKILEVKNKNKNKSKIKKIYITGGSSGSHFMNILVENSLSRLLGNYSIVHQTGESKYEDFERLKEKKEKLNKDLVDNYKIVKFLSSVDAANLISSVDLVIGRAGINTVTELIYLEKPALLIPLAVSQKSEQLKNAMFLKDLGLGEVLKQKELSEDIFCSMVSNMLGKIETYKLKENIFINNAADKIVEVLKNVAEKKKT